MRARIFLVGQNPGLNEVKQKRPFVGVAGKKLDEALKAAHLSRKDVYITNSVLCYTINNEMPSNDSIDSCKYFLRAQIDIMDPDVVVVMGGSASRSFNFDGKFSVKMCEEYKIYNTDIHHKVIFTVHPMYTIYAGERGIDILVKSFKLAKNNLSVLGRGSTLTQV